MNPEEPISATPPPAPETTPTAPPTPAPAPQAPPAPVEQPVTQPPVAPEPAPDPVPTQPQPVPTPVPPQSASQVQSAAPAAKPRKRKLVKILAIIGIAIVVLLAVIIGGAILGTNQQANIAKQFVQDLQAGNADAAYGVTSTAFQQSTTKDSFKSFAEREATYLPKTPPQVVSRQVSNNSGASTAQVKLKVKADSTSSAYNVTVNLVKESGKWLVQDVNVTSGT